tara:strand:- start:11 stop:607 length:597 start_codon:yes stop_codon:yes gene_type:complete
MFTLNEWYIFQEGFDKEACNKIISLGGDGFDTAKVGERAYDNPGLNKDVRVSDVKWLKDSRWIIDLVTPYIEYANINSEWKFDVRGVSRLQLTRYEEGGFYDWHRDSFGDHTVALQYGDDPNKYVRKLSTTVLLNDDYEGGEFQLASYDKTKCVISTPEFNKVGSCIVFPSFMQHRVAPVTKGTRYSLVGWFLGPPFK